MLQVLLPYVAGLKDRDERRRRGCFLDIGTAFRLFAFYQTHHADDFEAHVRDAMEKLVGEIRSSIEDVREVVDSQLKAALQSVQADVNLDGLNGGSAGRANIVDNDDPGPFLPKAFDPLARAMLLLGLPDQKSVQLSTYNRNGYNDRVGTHRETANRLRLPVAGANLVEKHLSGQSRALCIQRSSPTVDVVVGGRARRKSELTQAKRFLSEQGE